MPTHPASGPVSVEEHLARILDRIEPLPAYSQPLLDALGLAAAEDVVAPISLPVFDNSAMDGYAVLFRDVADATKERPIHLPVVGEIVAGGGVAAALAPGTAVRIMTGAPIPPGATAIVPVEWTNDSSTEVLIERAPVEGQHVRRAGEAVTKGDLMIQHGDVTNPRSLGLLASVGIGQLLARPWPRVVVMSTGAELVEPGQQLGHGQIYDSNSFMLAAAVRRTGAIAYRVHATTDDPDEFSEALGDQLVRADLVVTSGGVSKGTRDVVKEVLSELGTVQFDEVAMQPGQPQGFGVVGEDATPIFTLPGNPVSSYVSFEVFVLPALRKMMGRERLSRPLVRASMGVAVTSPRGRRQYLRGHFESRSDGAVATPVGGAGSHLVAGLAAANCLILVAEDVTRVEPGDAVPVMLLDRRF